MGGGVQMLLCCQGLILAITIVLQAGTRNYVLAIQKLAWVFIGDVTAETDVKLSAQGQKKIFHSTTRQLKHALMTMVMTIHIVGKGMRQNITITNALLMLTKQRLLSIIA